MEKHAFCRCMNCMAEIGNNTICPACGFDNKHKHQIYPNTLGQGTGLAGGEYFLGNVLAKNGEGFLYVGFSESLQKRVWIHEFMPEMLARRLNAQDEVLAKDGWSTQYKTQKMDFSDIYVALKNMESKEGLFPVIDCFEQNNTVYSVELYLDSIPLSELVYNEGKLSVNQTIAIFEPLFRTLSSLHRNNIVHRGISPSTIFVDLNGDLRLSGFAIPSVRSANDELPCELFTGYSAPEQYDQTAWQGTWTDIYGLSATLYHVLSGLPLPSADERVLLDRLPPLEKVVENLPSSISYTVNRGLALETANRVETVDTFIELFHYGPDARNQQEMTRQVDVASMSRPNKQGRRKKASRAPILFLSLIVSILLLVTATIYLTQTLNQLPMDNSSNISGSSSGADNSAGTDSSAPSDKDETLVPKMEGRYIEAIQTMDGNGKLFTIEETQKYSETVPKDMIISQSVAPGTVLPKGQITTIKIEVSKGPITLPDLTNTSVDTAKLLLDEAKVEYQVVEKFSETIEAGNIIEVVRIGGVIGLIVSKGADPNSTAQNSQGGINTSSGNYWDNWGD